MYIMYGQSCSLELSRRDEVAWSKSKVIGRSDGSFTPMRAANGEKLLLLTDHGRSTIQKDRRLRCIK